MSKLLMNFVRDESGQDLAEYALLLVLVSVALVGTLTLFKDKIIAVFESANDALDGKTATPGGGE